MMWVVSCILGACFLVYWYKHHTWKREVEAQRLEQERKESVRQAEARTDILSEVKNCILGLSTNDMAYQLDLVDRYFKASKQKPTEIVERFSICGQFAGVAFLKTVRDELPRLEEDRAAERRLIEYEQKQRIKAERRAAAAASATAAVYMSRSKSNDGFEFEIHDSNTHSTWVETINACDSLNARNAIHARYGDRSRYRIITR